MPVHKSSILSTTQLHNLNMVQILCVLLLLIHAAHAGFGFLNPPLPQQQRRSQHQQDELRLVLSAQQLEDQTWSQNATVLRRGPEYIFLRNFTVDPDGRTRWTSRDVRDTRYRQRRGFALDGARLPMQLQGGRGTQTGQRPPPRTCPVQITLCYMNARMASSHSSFAEAVERWHQALGPYRGVEFVFSVAPSSLCNPANVPRDALRIRHKKGIVSTGCALRDAGPPYFLNIDPDLYPLSDGTDFVDTITHELGEYSAHGYPLKKGEAYIILPKGHTLGLMHEHQRPDARDHVEIVCQNIPDYVTMANHVSSGRFKWPSGPKAGQTLTVDDVCWYGEISDQPPFNGMWEGGAYIPFSSVPSNQPVGPFENGLRDMLGDMPWVVAVGPFDRESIMLYPTYNIGILRFTPRAGGGPIPRRMVPSAGDADTVNQLYPPVPPPPDGSS